MDYHSSRYGVALVVLLFGIAWCDKAKDREECAESLVGLATCLPYVGGTAKSPTPDCCSGLKQMLNSNNKCLCVVIEDRNDPDLGLTLNLTLALALPHTCNAPAINISHCPVLLGLPPDSADAQIFYQLGQNSTNITSTNVADKGPSDSTSPGSSGDEHENGGCGNWDTFVGLQLFVGLLFLWSCYF